MWSIIGSLGTAIVDGISGHFKDKREIKKIKVRAEKKVILAEAQAKVEMAKTGQQQDYDLDRIAVEDMKKSWKDEFVLVVFYAPLILVFVPSYAEYIQDGFKVLATLPEWYMHVVVGITVVVMGMRGMLTKFISMLSNKFKF